MQVTAVLVVYGLPRSLTGSILAHELMHCWLRLGGLTRLSLDVEEGLCQLMALLWLESRTMPQVGILTFIQQAPSHPLGI